jgi:hypothetical protein
MLYEYETDTGRGHCYRPDLLPLITKWLAGVPESDWQYFVGFRVGYHGEFVAKFMKSPTQGGALRLITFTLDHNYSEMRTDTCAWWDDEPVEYTSRNLTMAADTY